MARRHREAASGPRTYEDYAETVARHITPHIGNIALDKLTPQDVQRMIVRVTKAISPQMGNRCRRTLRTALTRAMKWGYVARRCIAHRCSQGSPARDDGAFPRIRSHAPRRGTERPTGSPVPRVALALGLRQGEALGLRWQDIAPEEHTLSVRYQLQRVDGKPTLVEPKTPKSRRSLALPVIAVDALRRHRVRQLEE